MPYLQHVKLTPQDRGTLHKITVILCIKKRLARRDSKWFVIIFNTVRFHNLVLPSFNPPHKFTYPFFILILFSHLHLCLPLMFLQSLCTCAFRNSTCTLHAPLFPPFLISSLEYRPFHRTHYTAPHYALFPVLLLLTLKSDCSDHFVHECPMMCAFFSLGEIRVLSFTFILTP
jgi:hypothetical protein